MLARPTALAGRLSLPLICGGARLVGSVSSRQSAGLQLHSIRQLLSRAPAFRVLPAALATANEVALKALRALTLPALELFSKVLQ